MKYLYVLFLLAFLNPHQRDNNSESPLKIVIIRHGEKYRVGGNLNCKGLNRALHLPTVINGKFGKIKIIYVPKIETGESTSKDRMFQTVVPLAVQDSITINSEFGETETKRLSDSLKSQTGTVLVVWEHKNIPKLGYSLGLTGSLQWVDSDFDTIWIITYPGGILNKPQLEKNFEGLNDLPDSCSSTH